MSGGARAEAVLGKDLRREQYTVTLSMKPSADQIMGLKEVERASPDRKGSWDCGNEMRLCSQNSGQLSD